MRDVRCPIDAVQGTRGEVGESVDGKSEDAESSKNVREQPQGDREDLDQLLENSYAWLFP